MSFRIAGISPEPFRHLFGLSDTALTRADARRYVVDATPGFPDRIEMRDLEPGERALLVNYVHLDGATPYRASHAIFVREGATQPYAAVDTIPEVLRRRMLGLRAYDGASMMTGAELVAGDGAADAIVRIFCDPQVAFVHAHYAVRGCFAARIDRHTSV